MNNHNLFNDQGRSQDFSKGGHTGSNNIVMAFSPRNIVGCLLKKKGLQRGGGHGHPRTPLATPLTIVDVTHRTRNLTFIIRAMLRPQFISIVFDSRARRRLRKSSKDFIIRSFVLEKYTLFDKNLFIRMLRLKLTQKLKTC